MKIITAGILIVFISLSCKKEHEDQSDNFNTAPAQYKGYVKGMIFDSITNQPLINYRIMPAFCGSPHTDTLTDGSYFYTAYWTNPGQGAAGGCISPPEVAFYVLDMNGNFIKTILSDTMLTVNDTITVNLLF